MPFFVHAKLYDALNKNVKLVQAALFQRNASNQILANQKIRGHFILKCPLILFWLHVCVNCLHVVEILEFLHHFVDGLALFGCDFF